MDDAIVLAGGGLERERFPGQPPEIRRKAEIPLLGRPMVEWVAGALRASARIDRIVVVGHPSLESEALRGMRARVVAERDEIASNLRAGLEALEGASRTLAVSADLPLLTPGALDDLLVHAPAADVVFPYVEREDVLRAFPDRGWIFAPTPEGAFTGSSLFLFRPAALLSHWKWVEALLAARRESPLRLALMFGLPFALRLLFRRLRVSDAERKLSDLLRLEARGYRSRYAELAMDVDKDADIPFVEAVLQKAGH